LYKCWRAQLPDPELAAPPRRGMLFETPTVSAFMTLAKSIGAAKMVVLAHVFSEVSLRFDFRPFRKERYSHASNARMFDCPFCGFD
jgi:hypothetical protein